jgi:hypothetical protein
MAGELQNRMINGIVTQAGRGLWVLVVAAQPHLRRVTLGAAERCAVQKAVVAGPNMK